MDTTSKRTPKDTLEELVGFQRMFMTVLNIPLTPVERPRDDRLVTAILGIMSESGESAQAMNFAQRIWDDRGAEQALKDLSFEAIDVLFYLLELFVLSGMSAEDIARTYRIKLNYNLVRWLRKQDPRDITYAATQICEYLDGFANATTEYYFNNFFVGKYGTDEVLEFYKTSFVLIQLYRYGYVTCHNLRGDIITFLNEIEAPSG